MDDSGYFSSLDSSAMRPRGMVSDADRPRIKRGRAEEEIARLRGSSYDSPTKRPHFPPPSSSPLRRNLKVESSQMLPPLTPAVKLKPPVRPPPSASPNTNLRLHRARVQEMVGSPLRGMTTLDDNLPWSPAFNLDDTSYMFHDFPAADFDIFADLATSSPSNCSPEKRSARRPRLDRSRSANILADISNTPKFYAGGNKSVTSTPLLKFTPSMGFASLSPGKGIGLMESPSKLLGIGNASPSKSNHFGLGFGTGIENFGLGSCANDEFFGAEFLVDQADGDGDAGEEWDIMAGFQKIGSGNPNENGDDSASKKAAGNSTSRPGLGRSFTSRF